MIYPLIDMKAVGAPLILVERNLAIRPDIGPISAGIIFLVRVGNTRFLVDQCGRFYYDSDGEPKNNWYHPERLSYLGSDSVDYNYDNTRITRIGDYNIRYGYENRVEHISDCLIQYESSSSTRGYIHYAAGVYFYYNEYNYNTGRSQATKIGECSLYYKAGGQLDKVTYYGNIPYAPKTPGYNEYCYNNTVSIDYNYDGTIRRIGSTDIR